MGIFDTLSTPLLPPTLPWALRCWLVRPNPRAIAAAADPFQLARATKAPAAAWFGDWSNVRGAFASRETAGISFDGELGEWRAPFVMAAINVRVVRWSAALSKERRPEGDAAARTPRAYADGDAFQYDEYMAVRRVVALQHSLTKKRDGYNWRSAHDK